MKWRDCRAPAPETSLQGPGWASRAQVGAASGAGWAQREQRLEGPGVRGAAHGWGHSGGAQRPPPSPAGEGPRGDSLEETLESPLDSTEIKSRKTTLKENNPDYSLEGLMLMMKLKLQYFGHLMGRADLLEKTLMLRKIEGRRRG